MIINCSGCGQRYRIDSSKLKGKGIKFTCKVCHKKNKMVRLVENEPKRPSNINRNASKQKTNSNSIEIETSPESEDFSMEESKFTDSQFNSELTQPPNTPITFPSTNENNLKEPLKNTTRKSNKPHRFGITSKVTLIMLLISITPLLILWIVNYQRMVSQIHEDTEALMTEAAVGLSEEMNEWVDVNVRIIYALSKIPAIISMDPARQKPFLKLVQESYPWMYAVVTMGPDGMNVARSDNKPLKDYSDRSYVKETLNGKQLSWQTVFSRTNHKPAVIFSTPIRRQDKIVGLIVVGVNFDSMPKRIGNWRKGQTGYATLLDENYKAISHKIRNYVIEEKVFDHDPLILAHKNGRRGLIQFINSEGDPSVGVVAKTKLGWFLTVQQQSSEAFKILAKSKQNAIILLTATIFIVVLIAWFSGQAITKPIKNIIIAADRISVGDFDVALDTNIKNEIGDLAASIIRMKECIRLSLKRLQKRRASRRKEEFVL